VNKVTEQLQFTDEYKEMLRALFSFQSGREEGKIDSALKLMQNMSWDAAKASQALGLTAEEHAMLLKMLQNGQANSE
jgi:hypothetical protein